MIIGQKIKELRIKKGISVDALAEATGISRATLYRYENASIHKIPVACLESICRVLGVKTSDLMEDTDSNQPEELPQAFNNPQEALSFILKMPALAAYGGYDLSKMDDKKLLEFANEILAQIRLVSYKYK